MTTPVPQTMLQPVGSATSLVSPGKYALLAELGRGGMATAYLAAMQGPGGFNKLMVVKRLRPALATEPEFLRMFLQEARLAARIDHPNVVHTSEVGFDGEDHFIAMEYIEGQSLEGITRRVVSRAAGLTVSPPSGDGLAGATPTASSAISVDGAMIPLPLHLFILTQVLAGLDFAHELRDFDGVPLNVVHRDVSPHNVMVTYEGHVKLVDFGIAKAADSNGDTRTGVMKGKCAYMPAEQFGGKVDRRADIFAVGVMLWQALTGRRLWKGLSDAEVFQRLSRDDIPTPSSVRDDVDPDLESICMKALAFRPDDRFATAADFQAALEDVIGAQRSLRASPRETGKFVSELFKADREKVRRVIEDELGSRATNPTSGLPTPSVLPRIGNVTGSLTTGDLTEQPAASGTVQSQVLSQVPEPGSPRWARIAGICAAAAAAAAILVVAARSDRPSTSTEPAAAAPSVAAAVAELPRATLTSIPAGAKIFVDDAVLGDSPSTFERDGKRHLVRVEAAGYEPHTEWVLLDRDTFEFKLSKAEAAKTPRPGFVPPRSAGRPQKGQQEPAASPATRTPEDKPAPTPPAKGTGLDTGDPWAK